MTPIFQLQVKCKANAESNLFELCWAEAFIRKASQNALQRYKIFMRSANFTSKNQRFNISFSCNYCIFIEHLDGRDNGRDDGRDLGGMTGEMKDQQSPYLKGFQPVDGRDGPFLQKPFFIVQ